MITVFLVITDGLTDDVRSRRVQTLNREAPRVLLEITERLTINNEESVKKQGKKRWRDYFIFVKVLEQKGGRKLCTR